MIQNQTPPVKEGQVLDVLIESVGDKGDGVARFKGFVIFVPNTKKGDQVQIRITKVLPKVSFAELLGESKVEKRPEVRKPHIPPEEQELEYDQSLDSEDFGE